MAREERQQLGQHEVTGAAPDGIIKPDGGSGTMVSTSIYIFDYINQKNIV